MKTIYYEQQLCREIPTFPKYWVPESGAFLISTNIRNKGHDGRPEKINLSEDRDGYLELRNAAGSKARLRLHTAVLLAWKGPSNGLIARHLDDDKKNNRAANLEWGTHAENGMDKRKFATSRGGRNGAAKMDEPTVMRLRADGIDKPLGVLMRENPQFSKFGIWAAVTGYTWAHLPGAIPSKRRCTKQGWKDGVRLRHA